MHVYPSKKRGHHRRYYGSVYVPSVPLLGGASVDGETYKRGVNNWVFSLYMRAHVT